MEKLDDLEYALNPESSGSSASSTSRKSASSQVSEDSQTSQYSDDSEPFFAPPFTKLFPNLVLLLLRLPENDKSIVHPQHARHYQYDPELTTTTKTSIHVYRPIKPSQLIEHAIMGASKRETYIADSFIGKATDNEEDYPYPAEEGYDPRKECVTDIISKISFLPSGEFLPESKAPRYQSCWDDNLLMVDTGDMDDDAAEGSRSRNIAKGVFSFISPRPESDDGRYSQYMLPLITLLGHPFQPFLSEVSSSLIGSPYTLLLSVSMSAITESSAPISPASIQSWNDIHTILHRPTTKCGGPIPCAMGTFGITATSKFWPPLADLLLLARRRGRRRNRHSEVLVGDLHRPHET